ncbi:MAG: bacterial ammonia monooxygenase, subunit AmoB, partial [Candidatus Binatia bacterium]
RVNVNDEVEIRGRLHVFSDWPKHLFELNAVYLNLGTNGPVFVKVATTLNDVPMMQSTEIEYGKEYDFRIVAKARTPGRHHVHPMLNVQSAGPLLGPGKWIEVTGDAAAFVYPLKTLDGIEIPNLESWGLRNVFGVHAYWMVLALGWIGWWFRRGPSLLSRYRAIEDGREQGLFGNSDRMVAAAAVVVVLFSVAYGMISTNAKYPRTSALQGGRVRVFPLEDDGPPVIVRHRKGVYQVPGRSLQLTLKVTNQTPRPVRLGEFTAANLRFVNRDLPAAIAGVPEGYPEDLLTRSSLVVEPDQPIAPGETREIKVEAADAAWETERLASLMGNPDSSYGALLFFFDDKGKRTVSEVSGPAVPVFTTL